MDEPMPAKSEPKFPKHDAPRRRDPAAPRHLVGERAHLQSPPEDVQWVGERLARCSPRTRPPARGARMRGRPRPRGPSCAGPGQSTRSGRHEGHDRRERWREAAVKRLEAALGRHLAH